MVLWLLAVIEPKIDGVEQSELKSLMVDITLKYKQDYYEEYDSEKTSQTLQWLMIWNTTLWDEGNELVYFTYFDAKHCWYYQFCF